MTLICFVMRGKFCINFPSLNWNPVLHINPIFPRVNEYTGGYVNFRQISVSVNLTTDDCYLVYSPYSVPEILWNIRNIKLQVSDMPFCCVLLEVNLSRGDF